MKKLLIFFLIMLCTFGLFGCAKQMEKEVILPEDIDKITIAWNGGPLTTFSYTDQTKITKLREYFTSLVLIPTKKEAELYMGGTWGIKIESNSEILEMVHHGNMFFKTADGEWWEISYEQASELGDILKCNVPDELPQNIVFDEWVWELQEIEGLFLNHAKTDWELLACVSVSDFAYDCVGVVLYKDNQTDVINIGFMDGEGFVQKCGIEAIPDDNIELTYHGNGEVTFHVCIKDGDKYKQKISFSKTDEGVNFVSEAIE